MGCKYSIFTVRQGDTLGIQRRQVFHVNTARCGVYQGYMGCNTKGVGCIIKGAGCIIKGVGCLPRVYCQGCMRCNIEGVWDVNIIKIVLGCRV